MHMTSSVRKRKGSLPIYAAKRHEHLMSKGGNWLISANVYQSGVRTNEFGGKISCFYYCCIAQIQ